MKNNIKKPAVPDNDTIPKGCPGCGCVLNKGDRFCKECGAQISEAFWDSTAECETHSPIRNVLLVIKSLIRWCLTAFFAISTFALPGALPKVGCVMLTVLCLPVKIISRRIPLNSFVKLGLGVLLFSAVMIAMPKTEQQPAAPDEIIRTAEPSEDAANTIVTETAPTTAAAEPETEPVINATEPETAEPTAAATEPFTIPAEAPKAEARTYVLNTGTKKIHYPSCKSVKDIKDVNKRVVEDTFASLKKSGYTACGNCKPH